MIRNVVDAAVLDRAGVHPRAEHGAGRQAQLLARVLLAGAAYKPGVQDTRESPAIEVVRDLLALGAEVRGRELLPLLSGDLRPEMVEALIRVKARFKTGCITNNLPANAIGSASGRSLYIAEVMVLFDHVIESAKIGFRKPDPRIYRMMVDALGVDPKACVYLDDLGVNLKPARDMGMTTIKVVNASQAIAELEAATGLVLR